MKKFALLVIAAVLFTSCDIEDDGPRIAYQFSKVTDAEIPLSFEKGKTYEIDITYVLPSACHSAAGIEVNRGNSTGDQRRDIYVVGMGRHDANQAECNREEDDLEQEASFSIFIDEDKPYTFYLWDGVDEDKNNQYTVVEVPVIKENPTDAN